MTTNMRSWKKALAAAAAVTLLSSVSWAQSIAYDNSNPPLTGQYYYSTNEFGDQIKLSRQSWQSYISSFKFDYYMTRNVNGDEKVQLNLYANDGAGSDPTKAPGTLLYSSGFFTITPGNVAGYNNVSITGLLIQVPDTFTWTVQFQGIEGAEVVGLLFNNPPTVGSSRDDYWEKVGGVWTTERFTPTGGPVANFDAQVTVVPEPATIQLALLAGLAFLGRAAFRRR